MVSQPGSLPLSVTEFKPRRISGAASVLRPGLLGAGRAGLNRDSLGRTVAVGVALAAPHRLFRSAPHCLVIYVRPRRWRLPPTWTHGGPSPSAPATAAPRSNLADDLLFQSAVVRAGPALARA